MDSNIFSSYKSLFNETKDPKVFRLLKDYEPSSNYKKAQGLI